jgi:rod shape-determining protein MreB and related proteins
MLVRKIGIDLGTNNCLIYLEKKGIVLAEPAVLAMSRYEKEVVAIGDEVKAMLGRTPDNIEVKKIMKRGMVIDYQLGKVLLKYFITKTCGRSLFFKPEAVVSVPVGASQIERKAIEKALISAGACRVYMVSRPLAAAIGAGISIGEASGSMIIDIGGGLSEAVVISLGGVIASGSESIGGRDFDIKIQKEIKKQYGLLIGDNMAEKVKIELVSAMKIEKEKRMIIRGRDVKNGLPKRLEIQSKELVGVLDEILDKIVLMIEKVLADLPPEIAADVVDKGMVISGGGGILKSLDEYLAKKLGVPCFLAEDAQFCVAKGIGVVVENLSSYKKRIG